MEYSLHEGKIKFGSFLSKEAFVLEMNIRDMYYIYDSKTTILNSSDREIMLCTIKSMVKSHKRMLKELTKTGEFTGDIKSVKYR